MEVTKTGSSGIKIKGKNASLLINPDSKAEGDIILQLFSGVSGDLPKNTGARLIVDGPGEYEAGGISITVKRIENEYIAFVTEQEKILISPTSLLSKLAAEDAYDAVILLVNSKITDDTFAPLNAQGVILYGALEDAVVKGENQEKVAKINLKKDLGNGKIFLLS